MTKCDIRNRSPLRENALLNPSPPPRPSQNPRIFIQPQNVEFGEKDVVGLLCHRLHTDGLEDHGARALSSSEAMFPSGPAVNTTQTNTVVGMSGGSQGMMPPISAPGMPYIEGGVGGGGGTPSLRDLLLDRWSPTTYSEMSMAEGRG